MRAILRTSAALVAAATAVDQRRFGAQWGGRRCFGGNERLGDDLRGSGGSRHRWAGLIRFFWVLAAAALSFSSRPLSRYLIDVNSGRLFVGGTGGACDWFDFSNCDVACGFPGRRFPFAPKAVTSRVPRRCDSFAWWLLR